MNSHHQEEQKQSAARHSVSFAGSKNNFDLRESSFHQVDSQEKAGQASKGKNERSTSGISNQMDSLSVLSNDGVMTRFQRKQSSIGAQQDMSSPQREKSFGQDSYDEDTNDYLKREDGHRSKKEILRRGRAIRNLSESSKRQLLDSDLSREQIVSKLSEELLTKEEVMDRRLSDFSKLRFKYDSTMSDLKAANEELVEKRASV